MARTELEVKVEVKLTVPKQTAEDALKVVEMYLNETGLGVEIVKSVNGEKKLEYIDPNRRYE